MRDYIISHIALKGQKGNKMEMEKNQEKHPLTGKRINIADAVCNIVGRGGFLSRIVDIGNPIFSERNPTAWVTFDRLGNFKSFCFNPHFWEKLAEHQGENSTSSHEFVLSHEALHVILDHGFRGQLDPSWSEEEKQLYARRLNTAADLVVNHMLVNKFGFHRYNLPDYLKFIWVETVFTKEEVSEHNISSTHSFEQYMMLLEKLDKQCQGGEGERGGSSGGSQTVDDHESEQDGDADGGGDGAAAAAGVDRKAALKDLLRRMNPSASDMKDVTGVLMAGTGQMDKEFEEFFNQLARPNKKWDKVFRHLVGSTYRESRNKIHTYQKENSAYTGTNIIKKGMGFKRAPAKKKPTVFAFIDISGSCVDLYAPFIKIVGEFDPEKYNIVPFMFDTGVYPIDMKSGKLPPPGGGTAFDILEDCIQECINEGTVPSYPQAVLVITDGAGNTVVPEKPKAWHFIMPWDNNTNSCVPDESHVHLCVFE